MNVVDQLITKAYQENPILGALLGVLMDGGRIVSTSSHISELLSMVPEVFFFEEKNLDTNREQSLKDLRDYTFRDLVFIESSSVDLLWEISHLSGAQVVVFSSVGSDPSLCDYVIEERNLRGALMEIKPLFEKLKSFKGEISFDGSRLNKCLFLDRDGVVIEDVEYIKDPNQVRLVPKMINVLKAAREKGYRLVIVTNQSGIGRGMYNWGVFEKVNDRMLELLAAEGVVIDRILMSAYFENSQYASGVARKSLRKPRPGMIHTVSAELRIDLAASIMVGDRARDLMAAAVAGIQKLFLMSSKDSAQELNQWQHWNLRSRFENKNTVTKSGDWNEVLNLL